MPQSLVHPFTFDNLAVRGKFLHLHNVTQHCPSLTSAEDDATRTLLEMLLACAISVQDFKSGSSMTLQLQNSTTGAVYMAHCSPEGHLKAYANEAAHSAPFTTHATTGATFAATVHRKEQLYQSLIPLEHSTAAKAVEAYFSQSVQAETRLLVWPYEKDGMLSCSALFLQTLPQEKTKETEDDWHRLGLLAETLHAEEANTTIPADILYRLFHEDDVRLFDPLTLDFQHPNPRDRMATALLSLGEEACRDMLKEGNITMADATTGAQETFTADDIDALFNQRH